MISSLDPRVFLTPSEDDPLLQEPALPTTFSFPMNITPAEKSPTKGVFTKNKQDVLKRKEAVSYDSSSHMGVLFQMYGSVWPAVLPYCIMTVIITCAIFYLSSRNIVDLTFSTSNGHNFMAIMAREYLIICYRTCREVVQHVAILTREDSIEAIQWRQDVAYKTILLLRVAMAAIEYRSSEINTWDVMDEPLELLTPATPAHRRIASIMPSSQTPQMERISKWAHGERTMMEENLRAPIVLTYNLRETILRGRSLLSTPMHVNEELKILGFVSEFVTAFHGLKKLVTTPFPFPLVQMTRTFLFFWVFSLPFVLVHSISQPIQVIVIMFYATYGFLGLEYVSMELDHLFGDDPNDFDDLGMAEIVFENIYSTLFKQDGAASAEMLRDKVVKRESKGDAVQNYNSNLGREAF